MKAKIIYKKSLKKDEVDDGIRIEVNHAQPTETANELAKILCGSVVSSGAMFGGLRFATICANGSEQTWIGKLFYVD